MGLASAKSTSWEAEWRLAPGRHHLRVAVDTEARFWAVYDAGTGAMPPPPRLGSSGRAGIGG
jgi:hypothetical protein